MGRIIVILLIHVIGDYFFQGSKMSKLKASKFLYLFEHVAIYTLFFIVLSPILLGLTILEGLIFSLINGVLHLIIDFFIGKYKAKYYLTNESKYIETIGLDHTLHIMILIATYIYIFPHAINSTYNLFNF
ncbi:MAG: DUF3307 domain-containing protein [Paludibacter sp.]|nr:DUF3307 domain-containing protein [Paludibacter sp.]